jgi:hypothetical protein
MKDTAPHAIAEYSQRHVWIVGQTYEDPDQRFFTLGERFRCTG